MEFLNQTKNTVFSVIRIAIFCPAIPSYMSTIIEATIQKIVSIYEFAFDQLGRSSQQGQAKKFADELLKRFDLRKLASKDDLNEQQAEVANLVPILENAMSSE